MGKELPYFKFDVSEWINGAITLEPYNIQGLFINICAHYWFKSGKLSLSEIKRRLSDSEPTAFDRLIDAGVIKVDKNEMVVIDFLNEQLKERNKLSVTNSANGRLGGRPKSETKPIAFFSESESKAKKSNIEEKREEKEENKEQHLSFSNSIKPFDSSEYFNSASEAFEQFKNDDLLIEQLVRIVHNAGCRSITAIDIVNGIKKFLTVEGAKDDFATRLRRQVRQHLVNWTNKNAKTLIPNG